LIVLDASLMLAWLLEEDAVASAPELNDVLWREQLIVPAHWSAEIGNALLINQRRGRIPADRVAMILEDCSKLDILVETPISIENVARHIRLAAIQNLTLYDAAYLQIAIERSISLGTLDADLRQAANRLGISVLPA
jgi:predicted nucleic acid-binding protein